MITPITALYVTSGVLEAVVSVLIVIKTYYQPKKIRFVLLAFSLLTLPASIINILSHSDIISNHWNSFAYLTSTLFMLALHFWLNLDIGKHLRIGGIQYRCPYVVAGAVALAGSMLCLITQIIILLVRNNPFSMRPAFITGVCLAIFCDGATYIYSFSALINLKSQRFHEGQSKTTSLGVWFLLIQLIWYSVYGVLYVWFFCYNSWDYFHTLLVFDYALRFVLCLMFTWPPPKYVISFMSGRFFCELSEKQNNNPEASTNNVSAFTMTEAKENGVSFGHHQSSLNKKYTQDSNIDDVESGREEMFYSSNVAIVMKP